MNKQIPFLGINRYYKKNEQEIISLVKEIFSSGKVLMGDTIEIFEKALALITKRKYAITVSSCTDALYFALLSSGMKKGDEILTTGYSFIASATPILRVGGVPVFIDIEPDCFMLDIKKAESKITPKTKAIIAVSLYGHSLPIKKWEEFAKKHKLILIEDAAQSLGSYSNDRPAGSMGQISCISFDPTKIIGAFGTGGALLTDDYNIYKKVIQFRHHGKNIESNKFEIQGFNSQISSLEGALLNHQLTGIVETIQKRNQIARKYITELQKINGIKLPQIKPGHIHIFHKFVIQCNERNKLKKHLALKGIDTMIHYPYALFEQPVFQKYAVNVNDFNNIENTKNKTLSLPIYPELTNTETDYICKCIVQFYN